MKNKILLICLGIAVVIGGYLIFCPRIGSDVSAINEVLGAFDPKNATYDVGEVRATLVNGISEISTIPGSDSKVTTRYFGNEKTGDLNGDGIADTALFITQDTGGSGFFYYVVAAIKTQHNTANGMAPGYKTTNAVFIGDRIAPKNLEIIGGELRVNYADRKKGEPMVAIPSVGVTKRLRLTLDDKLVESAQQ